ncbi:MAG: cell division protein FtsZ [bacterium]
MAKVKKKKIKVATKKLKTKTGRKAKNPVKSRKVLAKKEKSKQKRKNIQKKVIFKINKKINKKILRKKSVAGRKKIIGKKRLAVKRARIVKVKRPAKIRRTAKKRLNKQGAKKILRKTEAKNQSEFSAETLFKARIKVVGVGGGGGSIVSEIGRSLEKATFVIADTDIRALKKKAGIKYFWFGEELTRGLGTGVNIDLAKQAAETAREKIGDIFKDQDIIIFVASLGGGLGSGATQIFAEEAKKFGAITFGIFTLPFKFEGKNKTRIALNALRSLRQSLNVSLTIPNEKIFKIIDESTPITNAFSVVNKSLINSLESLIDLIYSPGIINIDFADLRTILKGRGNLAFLNTIEESGKNRADKICEKTFVNPLLQNIGFDAEKILFNIMGSENLSMFEVERVSSHIAELNPEAKIIFGISKNPKLKNKIKTTILMTGGGVKDEEREKKILEKPGRETATDDKKTPLDAQNNKSEAPKRKKTKRPPKKIKDNNKRRGLRPRQGAGKARDSEIAPVQAIPVFRNPMPSVPAVGSSGLNIVATSLDPAKNAQSSKRGTIRRSGLEIKKAEEQEEKKRIDQEKEWEIPAFLRRVKYNK